MANPLPFRIHTKGVTTLIKKTGVIQRRMKNRRPVFLAAVIEYEKWIKNNFVAAGTLHDNAKFHWEPLKPETIAARRQGGGGAKILRDTDNLMLRWNRTATNNRGRIQSGVNYSIVHQDGSGPVPQRRIFPTKKQGKKIVRPVFEHFVKRAFR